MTNLVEMWPLMIAVVSASLAGSPHCVGMCGPFAILSSGATGHSKVSSGKGLLFYHAGRGFTYAGLGLFAGLAGAWFDWGSGMLGWQRGAAWFAGVSMILFGCLALPRLRRMGNLHFSLPPFVGQTVREMYRLTGGLSGSGRAFAIGAVTGYLPCGWLYAFLLLAVSTSHPISGAGVMLAFWLGTIPALTAVGWGGKHVSDRWKAWMPYGTAVMFILAGLLTVTGRASAMFDDLKLIVERTEQPAEALRQIQQQPLPCCQHRLSGIPSTESVSGSRQEIGTEACPAKN
ncbi:MAG: sulfite exporter TauE/SafE family protein [Planctomycetaceae bacterium]|nr:sulfite exporter TauE/SafE family protein [Planctomycetaceae bacterium]